MLMRVKTHIDFHQVPEHQRGIDRRLANWAAWCNPGWDRAYPATSAMFRMTPSPPGVRGEIAGSGRVVDKRDALKIAKTLADRNFPEKHRKAIQWAYVKPTSPRAKAIELGLTLEGLQQHLNDGRQMMINRAPPLDE